MWYLWSGPRSPLLGKDKIATFEIDLVEVGETFGDLGRDHAIDPQHRR